jgi:hypothetical protein
MHTQTFAIGTGFLVSCLRLFGLQMVGYDAPVTVAQSVGALLIMCASQFLTYGFLRLNLSLVSDAHLQLFGVMCGLSCCSSSDMCFAGEVPSA